MTPATIATDGQGVRAQADAEPSAAMRLRRVASDGGALLDQILHDPEVARTGFAERDTKPEELLSAHAMVWSIEVPEGAAGLIWLDTCTAHYACLECGLMLTRRGQGIGPRALLAAVLYVFELLAVRTVCFGAKEYNRNVMRMCRRAGIRVGHRRPYQDDFHPTGQSELVEFVLGRQVVRENSKLCRLLLRRPVTILGRDGAVAFIATSELLANYEKLDTPEISGEP